MAACVVVLERVQARHSPVLLESQGSEEAPTSAELEGASQALPDSRSSYGAGR